MFKIISDQNQDLGKCTREHDETIYQGILNTQIKLVKGFSLMTSAIGISCQPILLLNMQQNSGNIAVMAGAGAFLSFFSFATPLLIHHMSKKYVTEMNYNKLEDTYTAITYSLYLRRKEVCNVTKLLSKTLHIDSNKTYIVHFRIKKNCQQNPPGSLNVFNILVIHTNNALVIFYF